MNHLYLITGCGFGLEGARALSDALKQHPIIQTLWLGGERIQAYASKEFTKQSVDQIDNENGDEGMKALCEALKVNTGLNTLELQS